MKFTYYQDKYCYYFRKPAGVPSSFWKETSFLDLLLWEKEKSWIIQSLFAFFWTEGELGLLNRLDNETSWFLYFAKNPRIKNQFKQLQSDFLLNKYYIAEVYGDISSYLSQNPPQITSPIMHHKFNADRMVVIQQNSDLQKTKWLQHHLTTEILEYEFLPQSRTTILYLKIQKWIRHQIRAHLSSIGFPICWDMLYSKSKNKEYPRLQLFSVGVETI